MKPLLAFKVMIVNCTEFDYEKLLELKYNQRGMFDLLHVKCYCHCIENEKYRVELNIWECQASDPPKYLAVLQDWLIGLFVVDQHTTVDSIATFMPFACSKNIAYGLYNPKSISSDQLLLPLLKKPLCPSLLTDVAFAYIAANADEYDRLLTPPKVQPIQKKPFWKR